MTTGEVSNPRPSGAHGTIFEVSAEKIPDGAHLVVQTEAGEVRPLPEDVEYVLRQAVEAMATSGAVTIRPLRAELASFEAAALLGVSRPTVMAWARKGEIASFEAGGRTQFHRSEVLRVREQREERIRKAVLELLADDFPDEIPQEEL